MGEPTTIFYDTDDTETIEDVKARRKSVPIVPEGRRNSLHVSKLIKDQCTVP